MIIDRDKVNILLTPLVPSLDAQPGTYIVGRNGRSHFLDNLRSFITLLLIYHHASRFYFLERPRIEGTVDYEKSIQLPLAIFVTTNKAFIYETFFFVSGYSARLGVGRKSDVDYLVGRLLKRVLPVCIWDNFLRKLVNNMLNMPSSGNTYHVLDGPGKYVYPLLYLDCAYLLARAVSQRRIPQGLSCLESRLKNSRALLICSILGAFLFLSGCSLVNTYPFPHLRMHMEDFLPQEDDSGIPGSYIIAYLAGINLPLLQPLLPQRALTASLFFLGALSAAYTSLFAAQWHWPALWTHIYRAAPPVTHIVPYKLFLALWSALIALCVPSAFVALFASTPCSRRPWWSGTHTYVQTFVHMVPVVLGARALRAVGASSGTRPLGTALMMGSVGVAVGRAAALSFLCLRRRYAMFVPRVEVTIRFPEAGP